MTTTEAFKAFRAIAADKLTTEEIFKIYDIISAANMGGWEEGRKSMLSIYAPHVYKILYPEQNYSPMSNDYTERDMENAFEAGEINRTPEGFQKMSSSAWVQQYTPEVIEG
jgi:hypothetical protein